MTPRGKWFTEVKAALEECCAAAEDVTRLDIGRALGYSDPANEQEIRAHADDSKRKLLSLVTSNRCLECGANQHEGSPCGDYPMTEDDSTRLLEGGPESGG